MNYEAKWAPFSLNEDFWREVLVGRSIVDITFDKNGVESLVLDSGEKVFVIGSKGRICIHADSLELTDDPEAESVRIV